MPEFTNDERFLLLHALWNHKLMLSDAGVQEGLPVESGMAFMGELDELNAVVTKLGGNPTRPLFGVGYPGDVTDGG